MGYLDPGLFGLLSQAGLAILFVLISVFTFLFKPIKKNFKKLFKGKKERPLELEDQQEHPPSDW